MSIKDTPIRKNTSLHMPFMREFFYSFLLTHNIKHKDSNQNRYYRSFFVHNSNKNIVSTYLMMRQGFTKLYNLPPVDSYILFQKIDAEKLVGILKSILLERRVMIVMKEDSSMVDILTTISSLLSPL